MTRRLVGRVTLAFSVVFAIWANGSTAWQSFGGSRSTARAVETATETAREATRRARCVNNLKEVGLAFHNFHSANGRFPGNIVDKDGKPLLSWRVAILPSIGQSTLYDRFKLDEPWDGPNNRPLLKEMPADYLCPSRPTPAEPGLTFTQGWSGPGTVFDDPRNPPSLRTITDGTSNTIVAAEAATAVPWTKPEDMPFDLKAPAPTLGAFSIHPGGFNALYADGSVKFLKATVGPATLKALITTAGGEIISFDSP